jgi:hypothetical protein
LFVWQVEYTNRVSILSYWAEAAGVGALIRWEQKSNGQWVAEKVIGEDGRRRKPTGEMIACFFLEMAKGDGSVPKGGSPAHRQHAHARPSFGKISPGSWMTEETKKAFGWGAYASEPFAFVTVEQYCSAFAWFYDEVILQGNEEEQVNPAKSARVRAVKDTLAKVMGRGVVHKTPALLQAHVMTTLGEVDWEDLDEVGIALNLAVDLVVGARAKAQWMIDWTDVEFHLEGGAGVRAGAQLTYLADKDDREQVGRTKPVPCSSGCAGGLQFCEGKLVTSTYCPAHHLKYYKEMQAKVAGVSLEDMLRAVFASVAGLPDLPKGANLVQCEGNSRSEEVPRSGVAVSSREAEMQHLYYTGAADLVGADGSVSHPPPRGRWFEVERDGESLGYAVKPWGDANRFTVQMRKQFVKTNKRIKGRETDEEGGAGASPLPEELVKRGSSRSP